MVDQLARPTDKVEVYWFSEQAQGYVSDEQLAQYESGRLGFPNNHFDPDKAHILYNEYHDQYALADEVGFDGIMTNEHHSAYWCGKPAVNLDAAVICKVTKRAKIAILGNVIAINDPIRMAEEIAMLDCYSGGRIISGFVRGGAVESLQGGIDPTENRERFEEAHDLIVKCWTEPGPFRYEGKYYHHRVVNPWVLPMMAILARLLVRQAGGQPGRRRHLQGHQAGQDCHLGQCHRHQRPHPHGRRDSHAGLLLRGADHFRFRAGRRCGKPAGRYRSHGKPGAV